MTHDFQTRQRTRLLETLMNKFYPDYSNQFFLPNCDASLIYQNLGRIKSILGSELFNVEPLFNGEIPFYVKNCWLIKKAYYFDFIGFLNHEPGFKIKKGLPKQRVFDIMDYLPLNA